MKAYPSVANLFILVVSVVLAGCTAPISDTQTDGTVIYDTTKEEVG